MEDPSMVVSSYGTAASPVSARGRAVRGGDADTGSVDSLTGRVIETISEMSLPSIDADGVRSEATPVVTIGTASAGGGGVGNDDDDDGAGVAGKGGASSRVSASQRSSVRAGAGAGGGGGGEEDDLSLNTVDAVDKNLKEEKNQLRRARHKQLIDQIGLFEFDQRYVQAPADIIVIAVAMVFAHHEIEVREKQMASRWLEMWDDTSRRYKLLVKKGKDINGI